MNKKIKPHNIKRNEKQRGTRRYTIDAYIRFFGLEFLYEDNRAINLETEIRSYM